MEVGAESPVGQLARRIFEETDSGDVHADRPSSSSMITTVPNSSPEAQAISSALSVFPGSSEPRDTLRSDSFEDVAYADSMSPTLPGGAFVDWMVPHLNPQPVVPVKVLNPHLGIEVEAEADPNLAWQVNSDGYRNGRTIYLEFSDSEEGPARLTADPRPCSTMENLFMIWVEGGEYHIEFYRTEDLSFAGRQPKLIGGSFAVRSEHMVERYRFERGVPYTVCMGENRLLMQFPDIALK